MADALMYPTLLVLLFAALNVLVFFGRSHLRARDQGAGDDLFRRLSGPLKPYALEWFRLSEEQWPVFVAETRRQVRFANAHAPFVEFMPPPAEGLFSTVSPHGFRPVTDQGPWPPSPKDHVVFFFGGSTAMHFGPDWTGIANHLQPVLAVRSGLPVKIYNFGRGAYFSTQEMILFLNLLRDGYRPDTAIFLDGLNDFYFHEGRPPTSDIYRLALEQHARRAFEEMDLRLVGRPKWNALREFWDSLPVIDLIEGLVERLSDQPAAPVYATETVSDATHQKVIRRYLFNKRVIEWVAAGVGTTPVFVWQPSPAYKYDLDHHLAMHPTQGLCGHERSGAGYAELARHLEAEPAGPNFIWLADMQEGRKEPLYLDAVHYTAGFAETIAEAIAEEIVSRRLLPPTGTAPSP